MVSATDYPKTNGHASLDEEATTPRKRRGLLSALAAPFRDLDERAIKPKGKNARHKINGAPFAKHGHGKQAHAEGVASPPPRGRG